MAFHSITTKDVRELLPARNDLSLFSLRKAAWYVDSKNQLLAAAMQAPSDGNWRIALFERDQHGSYRKVTSTEDIATQEQAKEGIVDSADKFLENEATR
jgi:hypothetical protein